MGTREHKAKGPRSVSVGILSISTTRTLADDESGLWIAKRARKLGHTVVDHQVVTDAVEPIRANLLSLMAKAPQVVLVTGGTGISPRDVTIEAIRPLFTKELTAFGVLFAQLSFEEIDSAAIMSRAAAGLIGQRAVFCMPGSLKACKLACNQLIFPELGHILAHIGET
ncbi:MAG: molybdenum cofactor biosynthesis protein B [Desulfosarcinaceae bacterium]|nr:molybdenum cofactor biosynthesis protein B [Desulfosarcinaceae bacterium]